MAERFYAEYHLSLVSNKHFLMSGIMQNVVMLSVVAPTNDRKLFPSSYLHPYLSSLRIVDASSPRPRYLESLSCSPKQNTIRRN
jgi:hypothetical protein